MFAKYLVAAFAALLLLLALAGPAQAFGDELLLDAGANPSLCTCACECNRPRGAELLRENAGYGSELSKTHLPVKINNVA